MNYNNIKAALGMDYPVQPVSFTQVKSAEGFWLPRLTINRKVTVPYNIQKCEETGRIENFEIAAGLKDGQFSGIRFNDSDVFKVIEGAAYVLHAHPDPELHAYLDTLIAKIDAAQESDGYIYTTRTIAERLGADNLAQGAGEHRWSFLKQSHELYNAGHLYEAAVAHYLATGKRALLDVALKNADLIVETFGPGKLRDVPGHEEIELGLVKLYRVTGMSKYLDMASFFVTERGHPQDRELYGPYAQDHKPMLAQEEAVGHAVRAAYFYAGVADVAALKGDAELIAAVDRIWEDVVMHKLYLTGGIGARHEGEALGEAYELPNATAYNETCAAIANIFWNHRLFLLHEDGKYLDVLERTLYNGFLSGVAFNGKEFFYPNALASDGKYGFNRGAATRQPWFDCACCPPNVARLMAALPGYVYAQRRDVVYVNLFMNNAVSLTTGGAVVKISQQSRYPWDGTVKLKVSPDHPAEFTLKVRVPGWVLGRAVPSDLYHYFNAVTPGIAVSVNEERTMLVLDRGFAVISRTWRPGDEVVLHLPMPIRRVVSHPQVRENVGHVALERGPLVYCAEWVDNEKDVFDIVVPDSANLVAEHRPDLLNGVTVIRDAASEFTTIPYYAWSHRGVGPMTVWLKRGEGI